VTPEPRRDVRVLIDKLIDTMTTWGTGMNHGDMREILVGNELF
jgi:hypothetical protein